MKKCKIPQSLLDAADKCPHGYACLDTGECPGTDICVEDHSDDGDNILFLKNTELSAACPYRDEEDCRKLCRCPVKFFLNKQRIDGEIVFKQCFRCKQTWKNFSDFLADPAVKLKAYQVSFEELESGLFLFEHSCKTTLAVPAGDFIHLYDGPIFQESAVGTPECPEYCLRPKNLSRCPVKCDCAYVREVVQIIRHWPKNIPSD